MQVQREYSFSFSFFVCVTDPKSFGNIHLRAAAAVAKEKVKGEDMKMKEKAMKMKEKVMKMKEQELRNGKGKAIGQWKAIIYWKSTRILLQRIMQFPCLPLINSSFGFIELSCLIDSFFPQFLSSVASQSHVVF